MPNPYKISFETHAAIQDVATALDPLAALRAFQSRQFFLEDWRIIYADTGERGPFKLGQQDFEAGGMASTVFRGKSLWVLDTQSVNTRSISFQAGTGTFVDSNAASYIRSIAYRTEPSDKLLAIGRELSSFLRGVNQLNPYLYLWEAQRQWTPTTIANCREAVAAMHAFSLEPTVLDANWGARFRSKNRALAESFADSLLTEFQVQLDNGLSADIAEQVEIVEAMLVRAKIIELSSRKSSQHKLHELVTFMHEDLSTLMLRELIVCTDILCRGGRSSLSRKLHSLQNGSDPFALLKNCAWDLFLPRALDMLTNARSQKECDFFIGNIITFDDDVADIIRLTQLRAIALHRSSSMAFPFFNENLVEWLGDRVGEKRMAGLQNIFQRDAFEIRAERRSAAKIREILAADRAHLKGLLNRKINLS